MAMTIVLNISTCENKPEGNRLYRYDLEQNHLVNPKILLIFQQAVDLIILGALLKSDLTITYILPAVMVIALSDPWSLCETRSRRSCFELPNGQRSRRIAACGKGRYS